MDGFRVNEALQFLSGNKQIAQALTRKPSFDLHCFLDRIVQFMCPFLAQLWVVISKSVEFFFRRSTLELPAEGNLSHCSLTTNPIGLPDALFGRSEMR